MLPGWWVQLAVTRGLDLGAQGEGCTIAIRLLTENPLIFCEESGTCLEEGGAFGFLAKLLAVAAVDNRVFASRFVVEAEGKAIASQVFALLKRIAVVGDRDFFGEQVLVGRSYQETFNTDAVGHLVKTFLCDRGQLFYPVMSLTTRPEFIGIVFFLSNCLENLIV